MVRRPLRSIRRTISAIWLTVRQLPNPMRLLILYIGLGLSRLGLLEPVRARRTADLAWPRIVTGLARMSKNAVDVAMVGVAVGSPAIAGVGFASPFWGLAFAVGGGVAGGTVALVSQRYGADSYGQLGQAIRSSFVLVVVASVPLSTVFWFYPAEFISLISDDPVLIGHGATYLKVVGLGIPFAGLNLIGSRIFVGLDDAWTPMVIRAGGAISNIALSALLIFGFDMGVAGAALGTVLSNAAAALTFALALIAGRLPGIKPFPVSVDPTGRYLHGETIRDLVRIGVPVMARNLVWTVAELPMLSIVDVFGEDTASAYVVARRIWGLMNVPGWGFGLAASSLVGQHLGSGDEATAEAYGREIMRFSIATYLVSAAIVFVFAEPITRAFFDDPASPAIPIAVSLVYAACLAITLQGAGSAAAGALEGSGDTNWTFYSQAIGMFCFSIPIAYVGAAGVSIPASVAIPALGTVSIPVVGGFAIPAFGVSGLYAAFVAEGALPAAINYYRFTTGKWKAISRSYRPDAVADDD